MTEQLIIHNADELNSYKKNIINNLNENIMAIKQIICDNDALDVFKEFINSLNTSNASLSQIICFIAIIFSLRLLIIFFL